MKSSTFRKRTIFLCRVTLDRIFSGEVKGGVDFKNNVYRYAGDEGILVKLRDGVTSAAEFLNNSFEEHVGTRVSDCKHCLYYFPFL